MLTFTDQTTCYDAVGRSIDCIGSGHDGDGKKPDVLSEKNRFRVIDNTVTDQWTGGIWHQHAGLSEFPLTWHEALAFVKEMNRPGGTASNQWRLPSRRELFSLISHQNINPALPTGHPFLKVFNGYYWTSTECARVPDQSWYIHLGGGKVYRGMKHASYMVWPVSGPAVQPDLRAERFVRADGQVHDKATGRFWYMGEKLPSVAVSWEAAILAVRRLNGNKTFPGNNWRVPNIRELDSLVDLTRHSPAFSDIIPIHDAEIGCWSSTTSIFEPRYAWVLYALDGAVGVGFKPQADFRVIAVSGMIEILTQKRGWMFDPSPFL